MKYSIICLLKVQIENAQALKGLIKQVDHARYLGRGRLVQYERRYIELGRTWRIKQGMRPDLF